MRKMNVQVSRNVEKMDRNTGLFPRRVLFVFICIIHGIRNIDDIKPNQSLVRKIERFAEYFYITDVQRVAVICIFF